ncbi:MAG: PUA domain-containing protein, partial [Candidatus Hermodarchaeota archaeon]
MNNENILDLRKVKAISDYQFGKEVTDILFNDLENIHIEKSKNTNKIRYIYLKDKLLLTLRPNNSLYTLTFFSARKVLKNTKPPKLRVVVMNDVSEFIKKGRNVFCKHVIDIDDNLRTLDEIIVVDEKDNLLA